MRNISLLPLEIRQYRKSAQRWNVVIAVVGLVVAASILVYAAMTAFMLMPGGELNAVRQERADIQSKITELKPYEDMINNAKAIEGLVSDAMGVNPEWGSLFTSIYNKMPDNVWLTDYTVNFQGQTGEYDMKGSAKSHDAVAEWLKDLQNMDGISDVQCQFASKSDTSDGSSSVQFEIKAKILPGAIYTPAAKEELIP